MKPLVSIVVIFKSLAPSFLKETIPAILNQSYDNWELLLLPDNNIDFKQTNKIRIIPTYPKTGPADKKDIGIQESKGEIIAFIDDDAYPDKDWLLNSVNQLNADNITGLCGPGLTPPTDTWANKVSGWFWSSWLGSGGAGTYRCWPGKQQDVDDYPTFNLIIKKADLVKIGGFVSSYWPGEDTKLCHDLVYKLKKRIVYDPTIIVYHYRRPILLAHLKQLGRYGMHRGYFVRILPKTSKRLGYFIPAIFALGVICGVVFPIYQYFDQRNVFVSILSATYLFFIGLYLFLSLLNSIWVYSKSKSLSISLILIPVTFISHIFYGIMFIRGLFKKNLVSRYSRDKI